MYVVIRRIVISAAHDYSGHSQLLVLSSLVASQHQKQQSTETMVSISLDKDHGYVMLVVAGSFLLNMWQMLMVGMLEQKYFMLIIVKYFLSSERGRGLVWSTPACTATSQNTSTVTRELTRTISRTSLSSLLSSSSPVSTCHTTQQVD